VLLTEGPRQLGSSQAAPAILPNVCVPEKAENSASPASLPGPSA
jgi:hypothetical protein